MMQYANGDVYEGAWKSDQKNGPGTHYYYLKGKRYEGIWKDDIPKCGSYSALESTSQEPHLPALQLADPATILDVAAAQLHTC